MTLTDLIVLLPFVVVTTVAVSIVLLIGFYRSHLLTAALAAVALVVALATLPAVSLYTPRQVTPLFIIDDYALFFIGLIFAATLVVAALSYSYLDRQQGNREEFYLLLLLAATGSAALAASNHFISFFVGLETLSISLFTLIAYSLWRRDSIEAGMKYLVLAGVSSSVLLFGMALIYAELGTMELPRMAAPEAAGAAGSSLWLAGWAMLIAGAGFKLAVVPFHMWTPDVYEGSPAPTTAFVATVSKGAMVAVLLRFFTQLDLQLQGSLFLALGAIAVASMLAGNLLALLQSNVKRILAYSSIAHLGYLLVALLASGPLAATAVAFYLVSYFVTSLGAFGVVGLLSGRDRDADSLEDYRGLAWRRPWLAGVFTAMLLSLAGMPLTAGFIGKFYLVLAGVGSALWVLVASLILATAIGLFYYLRVVAAMYARPAEVPRPDRTPGQEALPALGRTPYLAGGLAMAVLTLLLVGLGVYPAPLIQLIQATVGSLG